MGSRGGGVQRKKGRMVGEWSALVGAADFPLFCCPDRKKLQIGIVSGDVRESQSKKIELKWLKGSFLT